MRTIVIQSDMSLIIMTYENGHFYFTIANGDVFGPYCEEREAYQEALRQMAKFLQSSLKTLKQLENEAKKMAQAFSSFGTMAKIEIDDCGKKPI